MLDFILKDSLLLKIDHSLACVLFIRSNILVYIANETVIEKYGSTCKRFQLYNWKTNQIWFFAYVKIICFLCRANLLLFMYSWIMSFHFVSCHSLKRLKDNGAHIFVSYLYYVFSSHRLIRNFFFSTVYKTV